MLIISSNKIKKRKHVLETHLNVHSISSFNYFATNAVPNIAGLNVTKILPLHRPNNLRLFETKTLSSMNSILFNEYGTVSLNNSV